MPGQKVLITAGGTGGHLYPAQALAQQLKRRSPHCDVLFVAGGLSSSRYFDREQFRFREVASAPLLSRHPLKLCKGLSRLAKGYWQSLAILKEWRPQVVVGFGSFYTVPILLAARWLKIPIILHEANSVPGRANQWLASCADTVALHFPATAHYFKSKTVEVGLPLREGYSKGTVSKEHALAYFGLTAGRKTLLVFGGSQGAQSINRVLVECIPQLKKMHVQVIHLTGKGEVAENVKKQYAAYHLPAAVKPFEDQMQMAWSAADAFVGRAGASTIAEAISFEIPGLLIPFPHATDNHQEKNADFLIEVVGSAMKVLEAGLTAEKLSRALQALLQDQQMQAFINRLIAYKERPHQKTLCDIVLEKVDGRLYKVFGNGNGNGNGND